MFYTERRLLLSCLFFVIFSLSLFFQNYFFILNMTDTIENHLCLSESSNGSFCAEWQISREATHNYLNTLVLVVVLPVAIYLVVRLFLKGN